MQFKKYRDALMLALLGIFVHLFPFLVFGRDPLGYDGGFYRRYLIEHIFFWQDVPGLVTDAAIPKLTFDILKFFHLPTDAILYGTYILLFAIAAVALYLLVEHHAGKKVAFFATIFFVISPVYYFGYWCVLFKHIYALLFLLLTARSIEKRSSLMYLGVTLIALTHQTTTIIFLLSVAVFWFCTNEYRKEAARMFILGLLLYILLHYLTIPVNLAHFPRASFLSSAQYLMLSLPFIMLAAFGVKRFLKNTGGSFLLAFSIVAIGYPLLHLPFYERTFLYTDIALVIIAAHGFVTLWQKKIVIRGVEHPAVGRSIAIGLVTLCCFFLAGKMATQFPMVSGKDLTELDTLVENVPRESYILTSSPLAAWVEGWSHAHVIAPGMLFDNHTKEEWNAFWSTDDTAQKEAFLDSFPTPLYIFLPPHEQAIFMPEQCAEKVSDYLLKYTCTN